MSDPCAGCQCPTEVSSKSVLQERQERVSHKSVLQECQVSVLQERQIRVLEKKCQARGLKCQVRVSYKSVK